MNWYNGFSPNERARGGRIINKAIKDGLLKPLDQVVCYDCGEDKGRMDYHNEDYSPENILTDARPLCKKCHFWLHNREKNPETYKAYKEEIKSGKKSSEINTAKLRKKK